MNLEGFSIWVGNGPGWLGLFLDHPPKFAMPGPSRQPERNKISHQTLSAECTPGWMGNLNQPSRGNGGNSYA
jgi:hypothetical protein